MALRSTLEPRFLIGLSLLCLLYLGFELFYNYYAIFSVDEFWFAHRIYEYKDGLPYRDFAPYKTVLGYYLLLFPLLASDGILNALIFVKNTFALLNTCILLGSSLWLRRFFSDKAILSSLALLISAEIVLCYSTNLRVDLLGYWFCFFSLLFLLENRFVIAGFFLGLGFITTQKCIWYVAASNGALALQWWMFARNVTAFKNICRFNLAILAVIALYIGFWSWMVDANTVITSVFYEASAMYKLDWYDGARHLFWSAITTYNPLLFLLWPLTLISLVVTSRQDKQYQKRLFATTYAFIILLLLVPYKQVFPYYMQVTIPVFFVLYTAFSDWLYKVFNPNYTLKLLISKRELTLFLAFYIVLVCSAFISFQLPDAYLLLCLIPMLLGVYINNQAAFKQQFSSLFLNLIVITAIFVGGVYPLILLTSKLIHLNGSYQKAHIQTMNYLLRDGSDYVAGIELIYNKTQPIAGMRHLMGPAIDYLYEPTEKLRPVMMPSLYGDPNATAASVIAAFRQSSVKFYVNNYRMEALPPTIKHYLASEYQHWWGSIYLYAPEIAKGKEKITLKFSSNYLIQSDQTDVIYLNAKPYQPNTVVYLSKGDYVSQAKNTYRLKLIPQETGLYNDVRFTNDEAANVIL